MKFFRQPFAKTTPGRPPLFSKKKKKKKKMSFGICGHRTTMECLGLSRRWRRERERGISGQGGVIAS